MNYYRKDIDGLRAVAVLLVVLYHCGFSNIVHGGFIGVDVFFVISGFLITRIILADAEAKRFNILHFYERRVRRIFPAILVVYIASIIGSFFILMPSETEQQARNALSSMTFASNIYFYWIYDYFDATSEFNAFLHTWSLSVEEQFYIFFPPIFVWLYRWRPLLIKPAIAAVAVGTLALSQWRVASDPSAAFYLVHYRAWELLAGAGLAIGLIPTTSNRYIANSGSAAGLFLIAASAWFLSKTSSFPGLSALPSVLGATLIIWAGTRTSTVVGSVLSLKPARFFGLISYSLYLWHWPIWVLGNQVFDAKTPVQKLAFIAAAIVVSTLSWWFVERPFRRSPENLSSPRVVLRGVVCMAGVAAIAAIAPVVATVYWRVPPRVEQVAQFINYRADKNFRVGSCFLTSQYNELKMFDFKNCLAMSNTKPNVLLIGDSHAAHFYPGLAAQTDINVLQATASGCRPIDGAGGELRCTSLMNFITNEFLPTNRVDTVIISGRWLDGDAPSLVAEIEKIQKFTPRVIVFGPIAEYDQALPRILAGSMYSNSPNTVTAHRLQARELLDKVIKNAVATTGAEYVSIYDALCPAGNCTLWTDDGNPIQSDYGHLTNEGSKEMIRRIQGQILPRQVLSGSL